MFMLGKVFRRNISTSLLKAFNIFASPSTLPADLERVDSNLLRDEPRDHRHVVSEGGAGKEDPRAPEGLGSVRSWDVLAMFPDPPKTTIRLVTPGASFSNDLRLPLTSDDGLPMPLFATSGCPEQDKEQEPSPCDARVSPTSSETTRYSSEPDSPYIVKQDVPEDSKRKSGRQLLLRSFIPASFSKPTAIAYAGMLIKSLTRRCTRSDRRQSTPSSNPSSSSTHLSHETNSPRNSSPSESSQDCGLSTAERVPSLPLVGDQLFDNETAPAPPCNECKQRVLRGRRQQVACWCLGDANQGGRPKVNLVTESPVPGPAIATAFSSSIGNRLSTENLALFDSGFSNDMALAPRHGHTIRLVQTASPSTT